MLRRRSAGGGRGQRAPPGVAALALLLTLPSGLAGQSFEDSYRVGGTEVPLVVALDSFAVVTPEGSDLVAVETRVRMVLPEASVAHHVDGRLWVFSTPASSRAGFAAASVALTDDSIGWTAGFLTRRADGGEPFVTTPELVVQFAVGTPRATVESINGGFGAEIVREPASYRPDQYVVRLGAEGPDALERARDYAGRGEVIYAHPNFVSEGVPAGRSPEPVCTPSDYPCDPRYPDQWHLKKIEAPDAWDVTIGAPTVTIAVLELKGFEVGHPDLKNKLWDNPFEPLDPNGLDPWKKSGDEYGWNFDGCPGGGGLPPEQDPCGSAVYSSTQSHGTLVAGVAGAQTNNEIGVASVCPLCRLMLIQRGKITAADLTAQAIDYATSQGADVLNMSFSLAVLTDAVRAAVHRAATSGRGGRGIPITVAVQQKANPYDFCNPTKYLAALDSVISVGATDKSDDRIDEGTGSCLDLVAPGEEIWTTEAGSTYDDPTGTSYAAPIVAGVAGLLISNRTSLSWQEIYTCLTQSADMVGSTTYQNHHNDDYGFGRVDAEAALDRDECASDVDAKGRRLGRWRFEVGVRAGLVVKDAGTTESDYGVPGAGPLGHPAVYGSWIPSPSIMFDLQLGFTAHSGASDLTRLSLALTPAARIALGGGALYLGPSIAAVSIDDVSGASTEYGFGAALGYHRPLGSRLAFRTESVYRRWNGLALDEWTFAVGFGVRLP